ncbi:MAG: PKD domain-containing protein [Bacteroidota bacterium]
MKKTFILSVFVSVFVSAYSQITMTSTDMPLANTTQRVAKDTLPLPSINFGSKGTNQTYNFDNLVPVVYDTIMYNALTGPQASVFTGADVALTTDNATYLFTKTAPTVFDIRGLQGKLVPNGNVIQAPYSDPADLFRFPTQYQTNFSDNSLLTKTVPGSDVGQPVSEVRFTITTAATDTIDGWGKVTTPIGSYKCLRKQRKETTTTLIEYKLLSFSPWATLSNTTGTTIRYTYPTIETKGSVINFDYDSANNVTAATYSLIPPNAPTANFGSTTGGGGLIFFSDSTDGYPDTYSWNYGDGSTNGTTQNPNHNYAANGAYYVCLTVTNAGGQNTYCDSVYVTGITSANNAPIAVTDTVTLLQATSITIFHVATNDVDPDNDNICLTAVWGSPYVTEYIGGSCDMVTIAPDSSFVGTDTAWYQLCDNGTPVLCDTGMIIFTVTADPNLLPVAGFTAAGFAYGNCTGATTTSNSTGASSLAWNFHPFSPVRSDSTYTTNAVQYYGDMSSIISQRVQVCLTATNQFGTSTLCDTVDLSCVTAINNVSLEAVSLYPNPVVNYLMIDLNSTHDEIYSAIEIYNALGEKVKAIERGNAKVISVQVSELPQGMYVATIVNAKGTRSTLGRFTKE